MRTRDAVLEYQKVLSDAGTVTIDLDLVDPVSAIELEFEATNGATSNKGNFISDVITKVEVVDGSDVLCSLNMLELEALQFYKTGKTPALFPSEFASGLQRHAALLLFGRHLWDPDYAMDFTRYKNPQLKITSNLAAVRAVGATGFVTATLKATAVAKVMEQLGSKPSKFLMQKELESFTSAASGDKRIQLPTDYVYRMLMLRAYVQLSDVDEVITDVKLTADTDAFIPFNRKLKQLDAQVFSRWGAGRIKHDIFTSHQIAFRLMWNKEPSLDAWSWEDATPEIVGIRYTWSSEGKLDLTDNAGAVISTDMKLTTVEEGHALHATLPIPFGLMDQPATWFNPKTHKKLELVLTQAVASAVCQVVAEQERPIG